MNILGLIPARGGSKGIPHKNRVLLADIPLIEYTFRAAQASQHLTRTILSTDDPILMEMAKAAGIEAPFQRPDALAQDETPMLPVVQHAVEWIATHEGFQSDAIVLLQPTSPLRRAEHIDEAVDLFHHQKADTVVSVVSVPHHFNPVSLMKMTNEQLLVPYLHDALILRRQDKPLVYARNGPALLIIHRAVLENDQLYGERTIPYIMEESDSIDIDTRDDLALAAFWLEQSQQHDSES